ncbi:hypothetical protein [Paraburkholderia sp. XV]|uniref:hypothetical protein n=1 Tax=Paraburkholderia sp. XV TaxID=2831520 RepID=UPI001CD78F36|nr:hypothetical protein [Paraburkholderia sp. XV]
MSVQWIIKSFIAIVALSAAMGTAVDALGQEPKPTDSTQSTQFSGTSVVHTKAVIFGIDVERNSITLLQDSGDPVDVQVDRSVGDVSTLKTGDEVSITYRRALLIRAGKSPSNGIRERIDSGFSTAQSVASSLSMHRVQALVTVEQIDRAKHQLTLRGATDTVTLEASSDGLLNGLKVGDSVRVDFAEATAIQISHGGVPIR